MNEMSLVSEICCRGESDTELISLSFVNLCYNVSFFFLFHQLAVDWKQIRRSFRKLDDTNDGLISVQDFRTVMRNFGVTLSSEELYQLLSELDENLEGRISYRDFLSKIRNV